MTEDVEALLQALEQRRENPRLAMEDIAGRLSEIRIKFADIVRNDPDGLPPEIVAAFVGLTGSTAPAEFQRVRRLVEEGQFTWTELYADPEATAGPEGRELVRAVHSQPQLPEISEHQAEIIAEDPRTH